MSLIVFCLTSSALPARLMSLVNYLSYDGGTPSLPLDGETPSLPSPLILVSEPSAGGDVAADVEVHDVAGETAVSPAAVRALHARVRFVMDVVSPREPQRAAIRFQ